MILATPYVHSIFSFDKIDFRRRKSRAASKGRYRFGLEEYSNDLDPNNHQMIRLNIIAVHYTV